MKKTKKTTKKDLSGDTLKEALWETMLSVKAGKTKPIVGNAVAKQAREICNITKLQLDAAKFLGKASKKDVKAIMI